MTYLLQLLLVVSVIYWTSLLIAELVLTSPSEQRLALPVRVGLGYVVLVAFFAAAFKLLPIQIAWALGGVLLVMFLIGRPTGFLAERWQAARIRWRNLLGWYVAWLVLANVFLLPLHLTRNYGPFTEGGGDVTIYADATKYVVDHQQPAWGVVDTVRKIRAAGANLEGLTRLQTYTADNPDSLIQFESAAGNPPEAEYAAYRTVLVQNNSTSWFSPTAQWFMFMRDTDYPVYYGVLAFQFAAMLLAMAAGVRRFGLLAAALALGLGIASQGLVSVPFNMYFPHFMSVTLTGIILGAFGKVRLLSWSGLRVYGLPFAVVTSGYVHFISVLIPLLAVALFSGMGDRQPGELRGVPAATAHGWKLAMSRAAIGVLVALFGVWLVADSTSRLYFVGPLVYLVTNLGGFFAGTASLPKDAATTYLGDAIQPLSPEWWSFFFGTLSQQQYPPLADLPDNVVPLVSMVNAIGRVALMAGGLLMLLATAAVVSRRLTAPGARRILLGGIGLYLVSFVTVGLHVAVSQTTLYTQAKGAQDVLVVLYTGILAVPAMLAVWGGARVLRWVGWAYGLLVAGFVVAMLGPRAYFAWDLANGKNRSTIIEPSYFAEAARIRQTDPSPFVLMEPDTSTDVYLTIQPFFGTRMLPTRHLSISRIAGVTRQGEGVDVQVDRDMYALDFVKQQDLDHLWTLEATRTPHYGARFPAPERERVWSAGRVADTDRPLLLLAGNYYERFFVQKPRTADGVDIGWFNYLRGGAAALVLPSSAPASHTISLRIQTESPEQLAPLAAEVSAWLEQSSLPDHGALTQDGPNLSLTYQVTTSTGLRFVPLVRAKGSYLLNVRIDDRELKDGQAEISALSVVRPGEALQVTWHGLEQPAPDDWVAVFPVGGTDATRVTWQATGGGSDGTLSMLMPAALAPGQYELRLYAHGTWTRLATTSFDVPP